MTREIHPMPGKALVKLKSYYENTGDIIVPDIVSSRKKCEAELLAFMLPRGERERPDLSEAMETDGAVIIMKPYAGVNPFDWGDDKQVTIINLEDIEAWCPESLGLDHSEHSDGAIPRCKECGPAKARISSNGHLMVEGPRGYYCPRCLKDRNGIKVDPDEILPVSDDEAYQMVGSPEVTKGGSTTGYGS